jgi:hypothetical protein
VDIRFDVLRMGTDIMRDDRTRGTVQRGSWPKLRMMGG